MSGYLDRIKAANASFIADGIARGYSEGAARFALNHVYRTRIYNTHRKLADECAAAGDRAEARRHTLQYVKDFQSINNSVATSVHGREAMALLREREAAR